MAQGDIELRSELDQRFRPIFQEYEESGGMPLGVLRDKLREYGVSDQMGQEKVDSIIDRADEDQNGLMHYDEFVTLMTSESGGRQLTRFQRMVRGAVVTVVPNSRSAGGGEEVVEDYVDHYNCKPPPLFMIIISLAELIIFIVYAVELKDTKQPVTATQGVPLYSPLIYNPYRRYEAWRFLSYMFIHQGYLHLVFNLIFQLVLGIPLEMVHKWWRVGIVYSLGVIAGSMSHSITDTHTLLAGASGGCYALIGAHFAIVVMNWKEMTYDWMSGPIKFFMSAPFRLFIWTLFAGCDVGIAIYNRYKGGEGQNIGYAAHFGGALAGVLIGIPVLKNIHVKPWERVLWWVALIAYLLFCVFGIAWNAFYPGFPETDWRPCCPQP